MWLIKTEFLLLKILEKCKINSHILTCGQTFGRNFVHWLGLIPESFSHFYVWEFVWFKIVFSTKSSTLIKILIGFPGNLWSNFLEIIDRISWEFWSESLQREKSKDYQKLVKNDLCSKWMFISHQNDRCSIMSLTVTVTKNLPWPSLGI